MNYIDFYYDDNRNFTAYIHKGNKHKYVTEFKDLQKLIYICNDYGYGAHAGDRIIDDASEIINKFDKYSAKKRIRMNILGDISRKFKLSRKFIAARKRIAATTLAIAIPFGGYSLIKNSIEGFDKPYTQTQTEIQNNKETNTTKEETKKETVKETDKTTTKKHDETTSKKIHKNNKELKSMLSEEKTFNYSYEDRTDSERLSNAKRYEDTFNKYAKAYGLDKDLLMAIAAQESSGDHYNNLSPNQPGKGIMQIEYVHIGENLSAHNFETNTEDSIKVDMNTLSDLDSNIKIGAMILRNCIDSYNSNIPLAVQAYNFGPGNMNKSLATCSELEHIDFNELKNDPTNNKWLDYRSFLNTGDPEYVEHVFSFIKDKNISILDENNNKINITLENNIEKSKQL